MIIKLNMWQIENVVSLYSYNIVQHITAQILASCVDYIILKRTVRVCSRHQWGAICTVIVDGDACNLANWVVAPLKNLQLCW